MVISRAFLNKSFNYNNSWCIERLFFCKFIAHNRHDMKKNKETKSTKKVVYKDRTQWLIHFQYYTTVHIILFLVKKNYFFSKVSSCVWLWFHGIFFSIVCVWIKYWRNYIFQKKDICNLYIILSSYTTAADPLK